MSLKGKTLAQWMWEKATGADQPATPALNEELKIFNPLKLLVGGYFALDHPDYLDQDFRVYEIREYTVRAAGTDFKWTAYCGVFHPPSGDPVRVQLRVENHVQAGDPESGQTFAVLLVKQDDEFAYTEDFHAVVTDTTGLFQVKDDDGKLLAEYRRDPPLTPIDARVASLTDPDQSGRVDPNEVKLTTVQYWDYRRTIDGGTEWLIVEMGEDGWFRIFSGPEIDSGRVLIH
jgi:hypothetical protein